MVIERCRATDDEMIERGAQALRNLSGRVTTTRQQVEAVFRALLEQYAQDFDSWVTDYPSTHVKRGQTVEVVTREFHDAEVERLRHGQNMALRALEVEVYWPAPALLSAISKATAILEARDAE